MICTLSNIKKVEWRQEMPPKEEWPRVPRLLRRKAAAKVIVTLTNLKIGMTRTATVFLLWKFFCISLLSSQFSIISLFFL